MQIPGYNFTQRMQGTLADAVAEAQALSHEYIGTEHLLLALLASSDSCGAIALRSFGVDLRAAAHRVLTIVQRGTGSSNNSSRALLPFSSRAKKVLQLASEEAHALNHAVIGTEHLLLGMLAEGKGIAAGLLMDSGVTLEKARSQVMAIRQTTSDDERREVPSGEQPAFVRVVLEYTNGAVLSKEFTTAREAAVFLDRQGHV